MRPLPKENAMTAIKKKLAFLKAHVEDHKVGYAVGMTAAAFILLLMRNQKLFNDFLKEHDLLEKFYAIED
jgi:hypothetical protein